MPPAEVPPLRASNRDPFSETYAPAEGWDSLVKIAEAWGWDVQFIPPAEGIIDDPKLRELFSPFDIGHYMVYYTHGKDRARMLYADSRGVSQLSNLLQEVLEWNPPKLNGPTQDSKTSRLAPASTTR